MSVPITLATAGHVDHGKTALVAALTGHDTDRLAEEKARGISIALGFAPLRVGERVVSLVDVPGHERFVRHMVAGASGVDGYLLCVAADDGVMPQTREHLAVLDILGVRDGLVAITKTGLADPARAIAEVRYLVGAEADIVPVDSLNGEGMAGLRESLARLLDRIGRRVAAGPPRLFVDRSFSVAGAGTVVTGTLWGESIDLGSRVVIHPGARPGRVRSIQSHDRPVTRADGGRVALGIAGLERDHAPRGSVVVRAGDDWTPTTLLDVALTWEDDAGGALRTRRQLQAFLGTSETSATCVLLDRSELAPGETGYAQLRMGAHVVAAPGDRLVLRSAERRTVGGARVIDAAPVRHGRGSGAAERLAVLESGDRHAVAALRVAEGGGRGIAVAALDGADADAADATILGGRAYPRGLAAAARAEIVTMTIHPGAPRATVVGALSLEAAAGQVLIDRMIAEGTLVEEAGRVRRVGDDGAMRGQDALLALLTDAGLRPPGHEDMRATLGPGDAEVDDVLNELRRRGLAIRAGGLWFAASAAEAALADAVTRLTDGPLGIGELRDLWGVGRRQALALAAHMDSSGLTLRRGDVRVLRRSARGG